MKRRWGGEFVNIEWYLVDGDCAVLPEAGMRGVQYYAGAIPASVKRLKPEMP